MGGGALIILGMIIERKNKAEGRGLKTKNGLILLGIYHYQGTIVNLGCEKSENSFLRRDKKRTKRTQGRKEDSEDGDGAGHTRWPAGTS